MLIPSPIITNDQSASKVEAHPKSSFYLLAEIQFHFVGDKNDNELCSFSPY